MKKLLDLSPQMRNFPATAGRGNRTHDLLVRCFTADSGPPHCIVLMHLSACGVCMTPLYHEAIFSTDPSASTQNSSVSYRRCLPERIQKNSFDMLVFSPPNSPETLACFTRCMTAFILELLHIRHIYVPDMHFSRCGGKEAGHEDAELLPGSRAANTNRSTRRKKERRWRLVCSWEQSHFGITFRRFAFS